MWANQHFSMTGDSNSQNYIGLNVMRKVERAYNIGETASSFISVHLYSIVFLDFLQVAQLGFGHYMSL
jgi:hypothetical protein